MDNPNNAYYPPQPDYQPPQPTGLLAPPAGKRPKLALAMVCCMALTALAASLIPFLTGPGLIDSLLADPLYIGLSAASLLLTLLVLLKYVLPGWEPHRKTLGWLLGGALVCSSALGVYGVVQGFQIGFASAGVSSGAIDSGFMDGMRIGMTAGGIIGLLAGIAMNPHFILLIGLAAKKRTEKVAGLLAMLSLGWSLLALVLNVGIGLLTGGTFNLAEALLTSTLPGMAQLIFSVIFYLTWPVLERPVLEAGGPQTAPQPDLTSTGP